MEHSNNFIKINNLSKVYGDFHAVNSLTLDINKGEIFTLLGPNGAGKTTTIKMLIGILKSTGGDASIFGFNCFSQREKVMRHVGYLPDDPVFYDYLTGREIIKFSGQMHGLTIDEIKKSADTLITRFDLSNNLDEFAVNYSKGMKKKLGFIIACLHNPEILILDEPTNGLDPYATKTVHNIITEFSGNGKSIFFSTHLLDQAEKLCTKIGIMNKGNLVKYGILKDIQSESKNNNLEDIFFSILGNPDE